MAIKVAKDLDMGGASTVTSVRTPTAPSDAATKSYVDATLGTPVTIYTEEVDYGATPVSNTKTTITNASVSATSEILCFQSGKPATGRQADENEFTKLAFAAAPGTGSFVLYTQCLTGTFSGKYLVNYILI